MSRRARRSPRRTACTRGAGVALLAAAALGLCGCHQPGFSSAATAAPPSTAHASLPDRTAAYLGVYEPGVPHSSQLIARFSQAAGRRPDIVLYYSGWPQKFQTPFARSARRAGATVLVDMDPSNVPIAAIASGRYDVYLRSFADAVRAFSHPVIISFGHEMNGHWYSWGWTHTSPAVWVRAWRHIVTVFRRAGADNVTWLWTVNRLTASEGPIRDWWPGAAYVTWVGADGYLASPGDTFTRVFGPTITAVRALTSKPVLIAETAVGTEAGQAAKIPGLFAGVRRNRLLGLVWFDEAQHGSTYHQDWRLEGHPSAVRAFRRQLRDYSYLVSPRP